MHLAVFRPLDSAKDDFLMSYFLIQVRLGWHDAGTYDKNIAEWPKCGGGNGSLRFEIELKHGANAGSSSPPSIICIFVGPFLDSVLPQVL